MTQDDLSDALAELICESLNSGVTTEEAMQSLMAVENMLADFMLDTVRTEARVAARLGAMH